MTEGGWVGEKWHGEEMEKGGGGEENTPCEGERVGEERKNKEVNCALR